MIFVRIKKIFNFVSYNYKISVCISIIFEGSKTKLTTICPNIFY